MWWEAASLDVFFQGLTAGVHSNKALSFFNVEKCNNQVLHGDMTSVTYPVLSQLTCFSHPFSPRCLPPALLCLFQACQVLSSLQRTRQASQVESPHLCARPPGSPNPGSPGWRKARKSAPSALRSAPPRDVKMAETRAHAHARVHAHKYKLAQSWDTRLNINRRGL